LPALVRAFRTTVKGIVTVHNLVKYSAVSVALLALSIGAQATTVSYNATPGITDSFAKYGGSHAIVNSGVGGGRYVPGQLTLQEDSASGIANLTGTVMDSGNANNLFDVNLTFTGFIGSLLNTGNPPPPGSPKLELKSTAYAANGGPVDPDSWHFYSSMTGTLTGNNNFDGVSVSVADHGPAFQIGLGANGKNIGLGASGWLSYSVAVSGGATYSGSTSGFGDINIALASVPEPSTILMMSLGLLGAARIRRKV
jgi:hypothetical protein